MCVLHDCNTIHNCLLHLNPYSHNQKHTHECNHWAITVINCALDQILNQTKITLKQCQTSCNTIGQTDGIIPWKAMWQQSGSTTTNCPKHYLPSTWNATDDTKMDADTPAWTWLYNIKIQAEWLPGSQDFKKGERKKPVLWLQLYGSLLLWLLLGITGNQEKGSVLCCSPYSCYFLAHLGVYGILCEW